MTLIGVDLNATRARALHGTAGGPAALSLEPGRAELPLALSLEHRTPLVGGAGLGLCRKMPHLACTDFLPYLGTNKQWSAGRHRLDATAALGLVCQQLQPRFARATGVVLVLPSYLSAEQAELAVQVAQKAKWNVLGSFPAPLAHVLAAPSHLPMSGLALVVDLDGHALTWSLVALAEERVYLVHAQAAPRLGLGAWMRCLIDGVARRCVRTSRRDPRASAEAEQSLFEQLLGLLQHGPNGNLIELTIQLPHWYQNLMLAADDLSAFTAPLTAQVQSDLTAVLAEASAYGPVSAVIMTSAAFHVPGLGDILAQHCRDAPTVRLMARDSEHDLQSAALHVLDADAGARSAYQVAARMHRGELPPGWITDLPLEEREATPPVRGPARLHFQGQDYVLKGPSFTLGRDPRCDLVIAGEHYPSVSARHCEVARDARGWVLRDNSRHGTLLNEVPIVVQALLQPGDWIRLGPGGPQVRFLGQQPGDPLQPATIA
jgi:hypothetical protein